jgi:hypothetical protein
VGGGAEGRASRKIHFASVNKKAIKAVAEAKEDSNRKAEEEKVL